MVHMKFLILKLIVLLVLCQCIYSEDKVVAITIDDVPNVKVVDKSGNSELLKALDKLNLPVTIFINEGNIYKKGNPSINFAILNNWIKREYVIPGNHTFSHLRCSATDSEKFRKDVVRGAAVTDELCRIYNKKNRYFRFPYNDLGKDEEHQKDIEAFLNRKGYMVAPFTIESSDWMFSYLYNYYLNKGRKVDADRIATEYVKKTLEYFSYFEKVSEKLYKRKIRQIYLCHDSRLNRDCMERICNELKKRGYKFASLDNVMEDPLYKSPVKYWKKWGVSWVYRWIEDNKIRREFMIGEPDMSEVLKEYREVQQLSKKKSGGY